MHRFDIDIGKYARFAVLCMGLSPGEREGERELMCGRRSKVHVAKAWR
jgi:hypothetical protein